MTREQVDGDLISREETFKDITTGLCSDIMCAECSFAVGDICLVGRWLSLLPTVDIPSATGHWEKTPKAVMGEGYMWYCDKCGHEVYQDSSRDYPSENFCPHCGADMRGEIDGNRN